MSLTWRRLPPLGPAGPLALGVGALLIATLGWSPLLGARPVRRRRRARGGLQPGRGRDGRATCSAEHAPEASALLTTGALLAQARGDRDARLALPRVGPDRVGDRDRGGVRGRGAERLAVARRAAGGAGAAGGARR